MQTYKYYLPTGERLAIFYELGKVTVIPCSKQDQFSKKISKSLFQGIKLNINDIKHWQFEVVFANQEHFLQWCNNHYKRMFYVFTPVKGKIIKIEKQKRAKLNNYEITKTTYLV